MKNWILKKIPITFYLFLKYFNYKYTHKDRRYRLQSLLHSTNYQGYSYEPFIKKRAIFIHIPKCAGVSINKALFGSLAGGHTSLEDYIYIFHPWTFLKYKKVTIVRNPWDRLVSAYFFLKKGGFNNNDKRWCDKELKHYSSFRHFVKGWLNRENIWKWPHFHPQLHYIIDSRSRIQPDFIGFFENIEDDFKSITKLLKIEAVLKHQNNSSHFNYMDYYDEELIDIVGAVYKEDCKLLGYSFDNSTLQKQLDMRNKGKLFLTNS